MVRELRIHQFCDWCWKRDEVENECEASIAFTVGNRSKLYDHCEQQQHANPTWTDLLELANDEGRETLPPRRVSRTPAKTGERAAPHPMAGFHSDGPIRCPRCEHEATTRKGAIDHLVALHDYDRVDASHVIKPDAPSVECEVCRFLMVVGPGERQHIATQHGVDVWEKIKAKRAKQ